MKNKEINGSVYKGVQVHVGPHQYEAGKPEVVELKFEGYNHTQCVVIDLETAAELIGQLRNLNIAQAE
jgi:hypothetical protein